MLRSQSSGEALGTARASFQSMKHNFSRCAKMDWFSIWNQAHVLFDELIHRAFNCVASPPSSNGTIATTPAPAISPASSFYSDKASVNSKEMLTRDTFATKVVELRQTRERLRQDAKKAPSSTKMVYMIQ
ncbi:hypothetical protein F2Q70_00005075 [Brassica cretica]|uniref:Uncharacterized protein n=1 Tax=Brassica cretica TaxID=69181 RepID=A0A8S9IT92_BRACR|nr:hypothetical protein F2Q68_00021712 [Brassica cretica]KAF2572047.1 hypothetical protein F2Q70_00005075 [Brassica cretica]